MEWPLLGTPSASRVHSLFLSDFSLGFLNSLDLPHPDLGSKHILNDVSRALEERLASDAMHLPHIDRILETPFAIHVCSSVCGSPPKLITKYVKARGCPDDCDANEPGNVELAKKISVAATAAHSGIEQVPTPSKGAASFLVNAIVVDTVGHLITLPLTIAPNPGGKIQLGVAAERNSLLKALGDAVWYISTFAEHDTLLVITETWLKPTFIEKLKLKGTAETVTFFDIEPAQKQIFLGAGKYNFLFGTRALSRKRSVETSGVSSLRACLGFRVDIAGVITAVHDAVPLDALTMQKFERKLGVVDDYTCQCMILQLIKYMEQGTDDACSWIKIFSMF